MINIRRTSKVIPFEKTSRSGGVSKTSSQTTSSPFAIKPANPLKALTERKSRLTEEQKLAILQRALEPYAKEARSHLPDTVQKVRERVRRKMLEKGFPKEVAEEADDETVSAILDTKSRQGEE